MMFDLLTLEAVRLLHAFVSTKLAELLAAVNARAAEVNWYVLNSSGIKSVQRGVLTIPANVASAAVTIAPVNTNKAELRLLGSTLSVDVATYTGKLELTNSNTITATRFAAASGVTTLSWALTEWK